MSDATPGTAIRWKIGARLAALGIAAITWVRWREEWPFQKRNLITYEVALVTILALVIWWLFLSRATWRLRWRVMMGVVAVVVAVSAVGRIRGMSGDMVPIWEWRWEKTSAAVADNHQTGAPAAASGLARMAGDFPQFYGPERNGVLPSPHLDADWSQHPPQVLWRKPIGAGWSGFAVVGDVCVTQEQRGGSESVSACDLLTGEARWAHVDTAHFQSLIGGEGPRATPTVVGDHVYSLGSTGILNCLDLVTGKRLWSQNVAAADEGRPPEWGAASSPLVVDDLVIVHGGEKGSHSLVACRVSDGSVAWKAGTKPSYASPAFATLAGVPQVLAFNDGSISAHDPKTGGTLWQRPWGNGNVVCASPVVVSANEVLFSSGYGVGAELLKVTRPAAGAPLVVESVWQSTRMKAKFSHMFLRDGCVFGLDDGIFACADMKDGSRHWREGRYGHGQGLLVGEHYLMMAESGDLVLLRPRREAPNELARLRVLDSKTWNPIALAGNLLLVRNDREAVCLKLATVE